MKRTAVICVLCVFLQGLLSICSEAQNNSCITHIICFNNSQWHAVCVPTLPPGAYNCFGFEFTEYCTIPTPDCAPPCPTCNGAEAAQPIDLATGNTYVRQTDVALPGLGGGLTLTRSWNSASATGGGGIFGHGWSSNFEELIYVDNSDHMVRHARGDGSLWTYGFAGSWGPIGNTPVFVTAAPRNAGATLVYSGTYIPVINGQWALTSKSGEGRVFVQPPSPPNSPIFQLSTISDRNGNGTSLTYDPVTNRLTTATDAAGRHLYFSYTGSVVTSVTSDFGVSLSYQYDNLGNLMKVIKPDNTFQTFEYSPAGMLTAVKDSNGKILESHTYDTMGRGLTSSRAGNVDSVTVSY